MKKLYEESNQVKDRVVLDHNDVLNALRNKDSELDSMKSKMESLERSLKE